ncbi:MAG: polysaccharide deacetylase family protein [Dokdonella sp.]|uniref:polysaccharide deacetylase family protein n=1 Tax=Dokdonella sp. TaxID=2291710 RepID=UPI0032649FF5
MNPRPKKLHLLRWLPKRLMLIQRPLGGQALYLTFDDGPHPDITPALLDLLAEHGARATFFLLGENAERYPDIARRIVAEGHAIGNHSYSHPRFANIDLAAQWVEIDRTDRILEALDGQQRHWFRPPSGALPLRMLRDFSRRRRGIAYWSYDSMDYKRDSTATLSARFRDVPPLAGDIVLMHDDDPNTLASLRELIPEWRAAGHSMEALPPEPK